MIEGVTQLQRSPFPMDLKNIHLSLLIPVLDDCEILEKKEFGKLKIRIELIEVER